MHNVCDVMFDSWRELFDAHRNHRLLIIAMFLDILILLIFNSTERHWRQLALIVGRQPQVAHLVLFWVRPKSNPNQKKTELPRTSFKENRFSFLFNVDNWKVQYLLISGWQWIFVMLLVPIIPFVIELLMMPLRNFSIWLNQFGLTWKGKSLFCDYHFMANLWWWRRVDRGNKQICETISGPCSYDWRRFLLECRFIN